MTVEEKLERLTGIVDTLASSVVKHDDQIEANNIQIALIMSRMLVDRKETENLKKLVAEVARQWQAYINTLPRQ